MITKEDLTKRIASAMIARDSLRKTASKNVASATKNIALLDFQKTDGTLSADGLYGPNSNAAMAWYVQSNKDNAVPEVNSKLTKNKAGKAISITWVAPQLAPAPAPAPAPQASGGLSSLTSGIAASAQKGYEATSLAAGGTGKAPVVFDREKQRQASIQQRANLKDKRIERKRDIYAKAQAPAKAKAKKKVKKIAKAIGPLPAFGQELLAQNIGKVDAEDVIAAVASGAPKIASTLKSMDAESNIANEFAKIQGKGLKGIKKTLLRGALQKDATSEHRSLAKRDNFRATVLSQLKDIRSQLAAKKAGKGGDDYRIVGLLL